MQLRSKAMNSRPAPARLRRQKFPERSAPGIALSVLALLAVPAILGGNNLPAQTDAAPSTMPIQQQEAATRAAPVGAASMQSRPAPEATAAQPPAPPPPVWLANQPLHEARVSWDDRGLEIEAYNSSLVQILHQVLACTGAALQGLPQDQRIFGTYGPGPPRDVLSKLLDGSGYNVLMMGGRDTHTPLEIVLSASPPASPQMAANNRNRGNAEEDEADPPTEPSRPAPMETPFGNGDSGKPETPQQIMQDILDRQPKIDQQQQREDQQNHPQP